MTAYSGSHVVHAQLTASTVDTVTLDGAYTSVEILNRDGSAEIYLNVNNPSTAPTVGGTNCDVLPAALGSITLDAGVNTPTVVQLISAGTPAYSVKGLTR